MEMYANLIKDRFNYNSRKKDYSINGVAITIGIDKKLYLYFI